MTDDELLDIEDDSGEDPFAGVKSAEKLVVRTPEEFAAEVDKKIRLLLSPKQDTEARREAAFWLGESGEPKAISALRKVYEKDKKNKRVQQAAAYALGQFKALDEAILRDEGESVAEALGRDENADILTILEDIALRDTRGKRLRTPTRRLVLFEIILLLTFAGLVVANLVVTNRAPSAPKIAEGSTGSPTQRALDTVGFRLAALKTDSQTLQQELTAVKSTSGRALQCNLPLQSIEALAFTLPIDLANVSPDLKRVSDSYTTLISKWTVTRKPFDDACKTTPPTISAGNIDSTLAAITGLTGDITTLETDLNGVKANAVGTATVEAELTANALGTKAIIDQTSNAPTITPTETPTFTPTPGIPVERFRTYTSELYTVIDDATGPGGYIPVLETYWTEARDQGTTGGCRAPQPSIPNGYKTLTEEDRALSPELAGIVTLIEGAMQLSQTSWDSFARACNNQTIQGSSQLGLDTIANIRTQFELARMQLDELTAPSANAEEPTPVTPEPSSGSASGTGGNSDPANVP